MAIVLKVLLCIIAVLVLLVIALILAAGIVALLCEIKDLLE